MDCFDLMTIPALRMVLVMEKKLMAMMYFVDRMAR